VKLAHLADVHLGFRAYHRQNALGINQREADVANAFRLAVGAIIDERPDAIVIAGDLFHQVRPTNAAIVFAFQQIQRIRAALPEAPIIVIAGNHDTPRSSETGSILRLYQELGVDVALDGAQRFVYPALDLSVLAVPHQALRDAERPSLRPEGTVRHQVLVLHGEIVGVYPKESSAATWGGGTALVQPGEIHASEWGYVALGHYHVQHQVDDRAWYAGALEYVTSNPWGEIRDEGRRSIGGKGWLMVDVDAGKVSRRPVTLARRVIDLPPLYGEEVQASDLDRMLRERLDGVEGGWAEQIVRQVVFNVPRSVARGLNHDAIRRVKAEALHYHLDLRRPDAVTTIGVGPGGKRQPLADVLRDYLGKRPLPAELDREQFVQAGLALLESVVRDEEG